MRSHASGQLRFALSADEVRIRYGVIDPNATEEPSRHAVSVDGAIDARLPAGP